MTDLLTYFGLTLALRSGGGGEAVDGLRDAPAASAASAVHLHLHAVHLHLHAVHLHLHAVHLHLHGPRLVAGGRRRIGGL